MFLNLKWIRLVTIVCVLAIAAGCATRDPNLKSIRDGASVEIKEKLFFSAISHGTPLGSKYYHALRPGIYKAVLHDQAGTFYLGSGPLLILGAEQREDGTSDEPLAVGGFWFAKNGGLEPTVRLFYMPNLHADTSIVNGVLVNHIALSGNRISAGQGAAAGVLSGVIIEAIIASGGVTLGPTNGDPIFVPKKESQEEDALLRAVLRAGGLRSVADGN